MYSNKIIAHTDGGCRDNPGAGAWGFVLQDEESGLVTKFSGFLPHTTNNQAEYRAVEAACITMHNNVLSACCNTSVTLPDKPPTPQGEKVPYVIEINSDSKLVVEQLNGRWQVKDAILRTYYQTALAALNTLKTVCPVNLRHISRELNKDADLLCNEVMDRRGIVNTTKATIRKNKP